MFCDGSSIAPFHFRCWKVERQGKNCKNAEIVFDLLQLKTNSEGGFLFAVPLSRTVGLLRIFLLLLLLYDKRNAPRESVISKICCIFEHFCNIICDKRETTDSFQWRHGISDWNVALEKGTLTATPRLSCWRTCYYLPCLFILLVLSDGADSKYTWCFDAESGCLMRQCCGPGRGFVMHITDNYNRVSVAAVWLARFILITARWSPQSFAVLVSTSRVSLCLRSSSCFRVAPLCAGFYVGPTCCCRC